MSSAGLISHRNPQCSLYSASSFHSRLSSFSSDISIFHLSLLCAVLLMQHAFAYGSYWPDIVFYFATFSVHHLLILSLPLK